MKFKDYNLHPQLQKGIEKAGLKRPTDIQYKSIPGILKGEDVLAVAQTGTGKTAAFAIPILHKLHVQKQQARRDDGMRCLVMTPTHELALQVAKVFQDLGAHTLVKTMALIGGVDQEPQIEALKKGVDVLVATPGRFFDLISQGHLRPERIQILVLDEADHMLDLGFLQDISDLHRKLPVKRQTLFFSATINLHIKKMAYALINQQAIRIQISPKDPVSKNVDHYVAAIEMDDKRFFLERIIKENPDSKILVFVRTKVRAERVSKAMERVGIKALTIHSDKDQQDRSAVLQQFREGAIRVLIATDVSARGIDIPDVTYVINYDLPEQAENYVHRVGRTGRGKARGQALSFCSPNETELLEAIEGYIGKAIKILDVERGEYENTRLLSEDAGLSLEDILSEIEDLEAGQKRKKKKK
ncbi:MAG: DEAD/DEAH box helicase [Phaeodactylibacter xiamenensis]|uniref:RNA helicase n=1 Tax=Phaeodactylibacter xiamenensis TaxID=1524460 RepID=A0A098S3L8_9BACT|nr:DEAD/DEAH box helicase [Phaeodactylibacter xiamenensis]KGE86730.1 RNA helicase [Phaeodactylibacter xiamenensis]MCR9053836.1 DEAD/DEAH box helicase [bacterium]